jgi:hypothetical protein
LWYFLENLQMPLRRKNGQSGTLPFSSRELAL